MKTFTLFLTSFLLVTCVYAGSPTISVKKKSKISTGFNYGIAYTLQKAVNPSSTGETLINWTPFLNPEGTKTNLDGVLISPKGKVSGKPFHITEFNDICCFLGSSITYNPVLQEYFAAYVPWYNTGETGSILAVRLDSHGKVIGKEITILEAIDPPKPNDLGDNSFPHLIFNSKTNGYVMIWERTEGIAAALLDENGKLTSPIKIIKQNPGSNGYYDVQRTFEGRIEDVQWLSSGKKLLVVFQQRSNVAESDDWLAVLDPLLKKPAKIRKINTTPITPVDGQGPTAATGDASLGILPDNTACVFYTDNEKVQGRTINKKGKFTSEPFPAFSGPIDMPLHVPNVAFSTTSSGTAGLLIASETTPSGVAPQNAWAQVIDGHCHPAGEAMVVEVNSGGTILFALPPKPSDNFSQFIWMQSRYSYILKLKLQVTP